MTGLDLRAETSMQTTESPTIAELIGRRTSRRSLITSATALALSAALGGRRSTAAVPGFGSVAASDADAVRVPAGYRAQVVLRWGDSLFADTGSLTDAEIVAGALFEAGAAARQTRQFGYNCDGMGVFERDDPQHLVVCVNHEFPTPSLMFPGWSAAQQARALRDYVTARAEVVPVMQAAVGVSVLELEYRGAWAPILSSPFNRRITADTPVEISGPARDHPLLAGEARGTLYNCAAGVTPWGTYLTAEENIQDYFSGREGVDFGAAARPLHERFGMRLRGSAYGWDLVDPRFDLRRAPHEPFKFGWIVEIDPLDPGVPIKKRTALGRCKHEAATVALTSDRRAAVYMGDDEVFEYFYKFVSDRQFDSADRAANRDLLDAGILHAARFDADGGGEWLPLVWSETGPLSPRQGFESQADVVLNCRRAADLLGATPLDRPEDVAVDPRTGHVYVSCTLNPLRGNSQRPVAPRSGAPNRVDAASPRSDNRHGHILELREARGDAGASRFAWEPLVIAGAPSAETLVTSPAPPLASDQVYFGGRRDADGLSGFAGPDNLTFDDRGNLWIVTDGAQPGGGNNGCFVCPTAGPDRGAVRQFMSGPIDAEICGCEITADQRTLFLNIQHPGSSGSIEQGTSHWPGGGRSIARPSMVAIEPEDPDARLGD